ncbi:hypothetical protein [Amycolatopsis pigmentata]|uniref:Neocarzinostatin family protein n=1 Tax=Amycolatopsis pigmentata TaxID=450801 RepID=A0ABW5FRQ4_9PSEU
MHRRTVTVLAAGAAVCAALVAAAIPAAAAGSVTIRNGNADRHFAAYADSVTITDRTVGVHLTCPSSAGTHASTMTGSIAGGTYAVPGRIGTLSVSFRQSCTTPLGAGTATPLGQPYNLTITGYDAAANTSVGYVGPVNVHASATGCAFDMVGNVPAEYSNATGVLSFTANAGLPAGVARLAPQNIMGCFGRVHVTDMLTLEADYHVSDPSPPLAITG